MNIKLFQLIEQLNSSSIHNDQGTGGRKIAGISCKVKKKKNRMPDPG